MVKPLELRNFKKLRGGIAKSVGKWDLMYVDENLDYCNSLQFINT